jgi:hypothetical protein
VEVQNDTPLAPIDRSNWSEDTDPTRASWRWIGGEDVRMYRDDAPLCWLLCAWPTGCTLVCFVWLKTASHRPRHRLHRRLTARSFSWWPVLVSSERKVLLAGCWWLVCSKKKLLLAGAWSAKRIGRQLATWDGWEIGLNLIAFGTSEKAWDSGNSLRGNDTISWTVFMRLKGSQVH